MANEALIVSGLRTPIGSLSGSLSTVPAPRLAATCIKAALERAKVPVDEVDEVILGNVLSAGVGQAPARQAAIYAGIPPAAGAMTINKVCGSGLKSVMLAAQSIALGESNIVVAGGMENMSLAPYLLTKARSGYRMGNGEIVDAMIYDGLWDIYGGKSMGVFGDKCAEKCGFSRKDQDDYAVRSYTRARKAMHEGIFDDEIVPVEIPAKDKPIVVSEDEEPQRFNEDKLRALRASFGKEGTVTAGNASSINDGAAALIVVSDRKCTSLQLKPIARVVGSATFSQEPEWFTLAPIGAIRKLMDKINWSVPKTDLFEINEAFSAVSMAAMKDLEIPAEKCNIYGGAVAIGHPIGCSGARILVTLLNGLKRTGGKRGIASLCIGGGEAVALAVELI
ncbi:MAG: acetyl-CoA C-acetyltransferase [Planctomycetota bacterium]